MSRWRALAPEQRQAAGAAAALVLAMFLPWYQTTSPAIVAGRRETIKGTLSAIEFFGWIEAAVLLVVGGVLFLLWARSERKGFHLPGGDGWAITAAGAWTAVLLLWRLFDKPEVEGSVVGIAWGIFLALALAGVLAAAGQRVRAAHRPEPPNPAADDAGWEEPQRRRRSDRRTPVDPNSVTEVLRDRPPRWEGDPPEAPGRVPPAEIPPAPPHEPEAHRAPPDRLF